MSQTTNVVYAELGNEPAVPLSKTPQDVRDAIGRFEEAQRAGAETLGSELDLTRRYELDAGALAHLPEFGLPTIALGIVTLIAFLGSFSFLALGIALRIDGNKQAALAVGAGVVLLIVGVMLVSRMKRRDAVRREGVECTGLYLLAGHIVFRSHEGCRIFERSRVTRFVSVHLRGQESRVAHAAVEYLDAQQEPLHCRLATGRHDALLAWLNQWLARDIQAQARA